MEYSKRDCPLCGSKVFLQAGTWFSEGLEVHLAVCKECGLVCQNPQIDKKEMAKFYHEVYSATGEQMIDPYADKKYDWLLSNFGLERLREGRFLEIGSWAGILLDKLRKRKVKVYGLEPSRKAVKWQKEQFNLDVENAFIEDSRYPAGYFRHIAAFQVLEHTFDPVAVLRKIRSLLSEGGQVVIETPNLNYCNCVFPPRSFLPCPRHLYIFSPASLCRAFALADLKVEGVESRPYTLTVWGKRTEKDSEIPDNLEKENPRKILKHIKKYQILRNLYYRPKFLLRNLTICLLGRKRVALVLKKLRKTKRETYLQAKDPDH